MFSKERGLVKGEGEKWREIERGAGGRGERGGGGKLHMYVVLQSSEIVV